jgi:hypothetical protein
MTFYTVRDCEHVFELRAMSSCTEKLQYLSPGATETEPASPLQRRRLRHGSQLMETSWRCISWRGYIASNEKKKKSKIDFA